MKIFSDIVRIATNGEPSDKTNGSITVNRGVIAVVVILFAVTSLVVSVCSLNFSYKQLKIQEAIYSKISVSNIQVQIDGALEWSEAVTGVNGDTVNYRIEVKNIGDLALENVMVRAIIPSSLHYMNGSTKVYNANNMNGITVSDNIVTDSGINIGDYARDSNAWIIFSAQVAVENKQSDRNAILRSMIEISGKDGINDSDMVDVAVVATNS